MNIIKDVDLIYHVKEYDLVLVGTSIMNALGNGFQKKVALNFPYVNNANISLAFGDPRKLGSLKVVANVKTLPIFGLCYINKGRRRPDLKTDYLDYEALEKCLTLANNIPVQKVATTLIGGSKFDGNGDRDRILSIIEKAHPDIDVYDYEQTDYNDDLRVKWQKVKDAVKTDSYQTIKNQYFWERAFGELTPLPKEYETISNREIKKIISKIRDERL